MQFLSELFSQTSVKTTCVEGFSYFCDKKNLHHEFNPSKVIGLFIISISSCIDFGETKPEDEDKDQRSERRCLGGSWVPAWVSASRMQVEVSFL